MIRGSAPLGQASSSAGVAAERSFEFGFDANDFRKIAAMLHADAGIYLSEQKTSLVYSRLVKRLRALGLSSFRDYCQLVEGRNGVDERQQMLAALTTNVTSFFRERHHFDHLRATELPGLLAGARQGKRVRIWSAGCSKGHEPYSLAITLLSLMPDAAKYDVKILASDIDPVVVATGRDGLYEAAELEDVPKAERSRFFRPGGRPGDDLQEATSALREVISFRELNLVGPWPMKGRFQIIFCRNVTIYFDEATQATVWGRFADALEDGGLLCIGHSERLSGRAQDLFQPVGTTMYRLQRRHQS